MQQEAIETNDHAWERLVKATVHRAIYNAEPRALSPCLESTRTTILKSIRQIVDEKSQKNVWLHGFPGSGKTSVLFTIADELRAQGRLAGTFFFSHNSVDTTTCDYVVPTLAYQLALAFPAVKSEIIETVADDPALLSHLKARKDQIQRLIIKHLWRLQFRSPVVFIIDALDESCTPLEAVRVARLLAEAIRTYRVLEDKPLDAHIILASRPSLHIDEGTPAQGFGDIQEISLQDDGGETRTDIHRFLAHELQRVVKSRKLGLGDVSRWPSPRQMDDLADKVGNSFLCASIAMKYIAHPKKYPPSRLDAFLTSPSATADAYVDLDHTYRKIIRDNSAELIRHLIDIVNLAQPLPRSQLLQFFSSYQSEGLNLALEEFSSILVVSPDQPMIPIQPYHSSLIEFFADPMRCRAHHIKPAKIHRALALRCFIILHELKANLCDLSDHTIMAVEDNHFWHKRDTVLPENLRYACRHWTYHLSRASCNEDLVSASAKFLRIYTLHWIEALCLLGELSVGPTMLREARAVFAGWAQVMPHYDFALMNRSLATAEQLIILYFDPISLFPLQVYYIVAALADLSGKRLNSKSQVLVRKCGPVPDSVYQFPVSGLRSSLADPGPSQGWRFNGTSSGVSDVLADCCHWLSNSDLGAFHLSDVNVVIDKSFRNLDDPPVDLEDYLLDLCRSHLGLRWVCLQIISETSQQISTIQPITWNTRVEFDGMTILADADHRCRLRVLASVSKMRPSKPGIILGEWLFNFRGLMEHADSDNKFRFCMYDQPQAGAERTSKPFGTLRCTIGPVPAFSTSEREQIVGQFPTAHSSNLSPGIFTTPPRQIPRPHPSNPSPGIPIAPLDLTIKVDGNTKKALPDLIPVQSPQRARVDRGDALQGELASVLDLDLTFKEPDEYERPEPPDPPLIRQPGKTTVFHDLKRKLRIFKFRDQYSIDHM